MPLGFIYGEPSHQVGAALKSPQTLRRLTPYKNIGSIYQAKNAHSREIYLMATFN